MNIMGYELILTCGACPEQYDVFRDGALVGYLRLRHGYFRADAIDSAHESETVYSGNPNGDGLFDDDERDRYLRNAISAIDRHRRGYVSLDLSKLWPPLAPDLTEDDREIAINMLIRWRADTPSYDGDDPRANHYRRNLRAIDFALTALVSQ